MKQSIFFNNIFLSVFVTLQTKTKIRTSAFDYIIKEKPSKDDMYVYPYIWQKEKKNSFDT